MTFKKNQRYSLQMKSNEIKWNLMKSSGIKWKSSKFKWNQMKLSGIKWNQVESNEI